MKKLMYLAGAFALMLGFSACEPEGNEPEIDVDDIVLDGFYVYGEATGAADKVEAKNAMSAGSNEVDKAIRTGMYEKYVWLEANKDFSLVENSAGNKKYYGANLKEVNYGYAEGEGLNFADNPDMMILQGELIIGENAPAMQVKETGLYHIVLDNNATGDLDYPQIIIHKADWGVRGGMNGWGFTPGEVTKNEDGSITYKWVDQNLAKNGEFKFASCHGWKINLDINGLVKAEVSLGLDGEGKLSNTGNNIVVEKAGLYTITLTYTCKSGTVAESFNYTVECTQESSMPETMYIIGNDFGNWDWNSEAVVEMTPVHSHPGHFWAIRHMTTATEFKFCALREWNGDFTGQGNDSGYIVPGNCMVEADGIYMLYVDLENSRVIVEPANVYGMGDCFGGWDGGVEANKFVANGQVLEATTKAAGNLRMYATLSTPTSDWWQMEFNIYDGAIVYRAGGNDQEAVPATAGQKVALDFNAGTGSIN